jgi:quercetin dioxygenase-like cupin family protein
MGIRCPSAANTSHPQARFTDMVIPARRHAVIDREPGDPPALAREINMPTVPRRVVTGHDQRGVSVFLQDGPPPVARTAPDGALFYEIWGTEAMPAPVSAAEPDPTEASLSVPPAPGGTKIRINEFPPGVVSPTHRTQSVDYGIVLDGEIVLVLDDSETVLGPGDVVVQRGTAHRWENRTERTARMAFVLVDGVFTEELLDALDSDVLDSLLHDPMRP